MARRSKFQREKDLEEIARRYLRKETQHQISLDLDVNQKSVSNDLKAIQKRWLASSIRNFDDSVAEELAKIDHLEREYWVAWEKSKEDEQAETVEQINYSGTDIDGVGAQSERLKKNVKKIGQVGDPRFLQGVERCIDKRMKILGLEAPQQHQYFGKEGEPPIAIKSEINTITLRQYIEKKE